MPKPDRQTPRSQDRPIPAVSPARAAAFDILLRVERRNAFATELLHSRLTEDLSPADHALCTELVLGTLRWRSRLDLGLAEVVSQRLDKLDPEVLAALRLAAYQIGFLRVPARAAVNESVELVKRARKRSATGLVNAALRKLAATPALMEPALSPGRKTVVDLAQLYAHPAWLVERWAARFGMETAEKICAAGQHAPGIALRVRGAAADSELRGVAVEPGALLTGARRITTKARWTVKPTNRLTIQDEASQLVGLLVGRGERILDCCAAPGGKTAILAERNLGALVVAAEIHPHRARLMRELIAPAIVQQGAWALPRNVHVLAADATRLPLCTAFDRILADVPCSGTGTLSRNPEIKWRLTPADLDDLHSRQVAILRASLEALAPGGRLVYSTCSLEPEENERVVEEALGGDFHILPVREELEHLRDEIAWPDLDSLTDGPYLRTLPGIHPCDGFFAAMVGRSR